ncbi:DivIVA domain-containing protein [Nocardioides massiliensis]|uniref:DivIVA domain-containing protein n=1 Tax=Nocardioides massiliensis TaxID=1325935 RepID=A0ABT9NJY9_9ACTN|nr:DivIVA domain-containing protein [Nocardioides massiliensis]MDP9820722.1 DivIVA domain-containing protein [Nocardioides massiliensis]
MLSPCIPHGDLTAATVRDVRFTPRRFRAGYDMDEVDVYLDAVLTELNRLRGPQTS